MKLAKYYGITLLWFLGFLLGGSIVVSLFYYTFLPSKVVNIFIFLYIGIVFFFFGYKFGLKAEARGFVEGLKISFILVLVLILFNLIFSQQSFSLLRMLYYIVLVFSGTIGSMIGINRKKE